MNIEVKFPRQSEEHDESLITFWHVSEGDRVEKGDPLVEVQTEKAVSEIEAPESGIIIEIRKKRGETVKVNEPFVVIGTTIENQSAGKLEGGVTVEEKPLAQEDVKLVIANTEIKASPRIKKLAGELGINWRTVKPSGPNGKLTEEDLKRAAEKQTNFRIIEEQVPVIENKQEIQKPKVVIAAPSVRKYAREHNIKLEDIITNSPKGKILKSDIDHAVKKKIELENQLNEIEKIPFSGIRKVIAKSMVYSVTTIPQVTHFDKVDVSNLVKVRHKVKKYFEEEGVKLTYLAYIVKSLTAALKKYPILNARLDDEGKEIILYKNYHIGFAVNTDRGLIVPVIKNAEDKSLMDIAKEIQEFSQKAREGTINATEMSGGTCTISNIGSAQGSWFTPIINPPQSCILGIGKIEKQAIVVNDTIEIRPVMAMSLTYDHRLIDGVMAQQALNQLKEYVSEPDLLLSIQ
jgi:pyruvate dehydrogenase E2 component (dihydrolipoamide acetyltransferase)